MNFNLNFLENVKPFSKNWSLKYIENTSFTFKTALSEANAKTNRMTTRKWTYHKEWSFASKYFIFFGKYFLERVDLMYQ